MIIFYTTKFHIKNLIIPTYFYWYLLQKCTIQMLQMSRQNKKFRATRVSISRSGRHTATGYFTFTRDRGVDFQVWSCQFIANCIQLVLVVKCCQILLKWCQTSSERIKRSATNPRISKCSYISYPRVLKHTKMYPSAKLTNVSTRKKSSNHSSDTKDGTDPRAIEYAWIYLDALLDFILYALDRIPLLLDSCEYVWILLIRVKLNLDKRGRSNVVHFSYIRNVLVLVDRLPLSMKV